MIGSSDITFSCRLQKKNYDFYKNEEVIGIACGLRTKSSRKKKAMKEQCKQ